ncbi:hypothetical protein HMI54_001090 [Coelomomyces lativittatus]|nr:hypothetical protein HMI54_001090 [Coelomomyces lativittatus]KAJ1514689.1 hypothetical protein HMI56_007644 [Coelomomyces lativittatus]KAJ1516966.1 hypothetical protein HMI55_000952 [Coelomomyces lativittatus]
MSTIEQKIDETLLLVDQLNDVNNNSGLESIEKMREQLKDISEKQEALKQASMANNEENIFKNLPSHLNKPYLMPSLSQPYSMNDEELVQKMILGLEKLYQNEITVLKTSNENLRQQKQNLRMENEELKKNFTIGRREMELSMQEERIQFLEKIRDLENKSLEFTKLPFQPLTEEQFRNIQEQTTSQQIYIHRMQSEIEDLRADKTDLEMEHSNSLRALQRQINDLTTQCEMLNSTKEDYTHQINQFQEELHTWVIKNKDLTQQNSVLQLEVNDYKNRLEEQTHVLQQQLFSLQSKFNQSQTQHEKLLNEKQLKIDVLKADVLSLEEQLQDEKMENKMIESSHKEQLEEFQKEKEDLLRRAHVNKLELAEELNKLKNERDQCRNSHLLEVEVLTKKLSDISLHSREVSSEKHSLLKKLEELESQLHLEREHKKKVLEELKEYESRLQSTHEDVAALRTAMSWTRPQYEEEKKKNQELKIQLSEQQAAFRQQHEEYTQSMEQAKNTWSRTVLELKELLDNTSKEKAELEELSTKIKKAALKKVLQYKSEVQNYHKALSEAQHKIDQLQLCLEVKSKTIEKENTDFPLTREKLLSLFQKEIQEIPKCGSGL